MEDKTVSSTLNTEIELEVEVNYDYQPQEPSDGAYPGCDEEISINSVMLGETDILGRLIGDELENITEACRRNEETVDFD